MSMSFSTYSIRRIEYGCMKIAKHTISPATCFSIPFISFLFFSLSNQHKNVAELFFLFFFFYFQLNIFCFFFFGVYIVKLLLRVCSMRMTIAAAEIFNCQFGRLCSIKTNERELLFFSFFFAFLICVQLTIFTISHNSCDYNNERVRFNSGNFVLFLCYF